MTLQGTATQPTVRNDTKPHLFTEDNAKEKGRKGGLASAESRSRKKTLDELKAMGPEVLDEVLKAGFGRGQWGKLDHKTRIDALKFALPFLLGRPTPMKEGPGEEENQNDGTFGIEVAPS